MQRASALVLQSVYPPVQRPRSAPVLQEITQAVQLDRARNTRLRRGEEAARASSSRQWSLLTGGESRRDAARSHHRDATHLLQGAALPDPGSCCVAEDTKQAKLKARQRLACKWQGYPSISATPNLLFAGDTIPDRDAGLNAPNGS